MPVPAFDGITSALPPFIGRIEHRGMVSPYPCTMEEIALALGTSTERRAILNGLLDLRRALRSLGIEAIQWLDGSFVEDKESHRGVPPNDIDVVTYARGDLRRLHGNLLLSRTHVMRTYSVDHLLVHLRPNWLDLVADISDWYALFSHRRDGTWKGMLQVALTADADEDARARTLLGGTA